MLRFFERLKAKLRRPPKRMPPPWDLVLRTASGPVVEEVEAQEDVEVVAPAELGPLAKLTPFRPVVISLLRLLDSEEMDLAEAAGLVESDPVVASELLALANSPLFALSSRISSPKHALSLLGRQRAKSLVTSMAMRSIMISAPRNAVVRRFWTHCTATAAVAQELAPVFRVNGGTAHAMAITHDLGRMGLLAAHPDEYEKIALKVYENPDHILEAERTQFGMDHCQCGALLARSWRLPSYCKKAAERHHEPVASRTALSLVQFSCSLADALMFQAVLHRGAVPVANLIETAPREIRSLLAERVAQLEAAVIRTIKELDY